MTFAEDLERRLAERKNEAEVGRKVDAVAPPLDPMAIMRDAATLGSEQIRRSVISAAVAEGVGEHTAEIIAARVVDMMMAPFR